MSEPLSAHERELCEAIHTPGNHLPPYAVRLGDAVWYEGDDSISHEECLAALPTFVNSEVAGEPVAKLYSEIKQHLDCCESCATQYVDLLELTLADFNGEIPKTAAGMPLDTSFLPRGPLIRVAERQSRAVSQVFLPKRLTELKVIADDFFNRVEVLGGKFTLQPNAAYALA